MSETDRWLSDYGDSHRNITHPVIYWLAVPALVVGTVGLLWTLPVPQEFTTISPILNWGTTFLMATLVYYFIISIALAIGMLPFIIGIAALQVAMSRSGDSQLEVSLTLILAGIAGLYMGHYSRDGFRAVLRDIQLMMIAPVWILSNLYRRLGIPY